MDVAGSSEVYARGIFRLFVGWALLLATGCATGAAFQSTSTAGSFQGDWALGELDSEPLVAKHLSSASLSPPSANANTWPLAYTVELDAKGRLRADGQPVGNIQQLGRLSSEAARKNTFAAAVLFAAPEVSQQTRSKVTQTLIGSGFAQVRVAGRSAPESLRPTVVAPAPRVVALAPAVAAAVNKPARKVSEPPPGDPVTVQTVGLHVGGGAANEAARQRLVRHFERHFDELVSCHRFAQDRLGNALFGIDLYVPAAGGHARIGQVRSRLRSREFRQCMTRKFSAIEFPAPDSGQESAVSYSVLFKPKTVSSP